MTVAVQKLRPQYSTHVTANIHTRHVQHLGLSSSAIVKRRQKIISDTEFFCFVFYVFAPATNYWPVWKCKAYCRNCIVLLSRLESFEGPTSWSRNPEHFCRTIPSPYLHRPMHTVISLHAVQNQQRLGAVTQPEIIKTDTAPPYWYHTGWTKCQARSQYVYIRLQLSAVL